MKQDFENFLMEKHGEHYIGTKGYIVDNFADWITNLDIDTLVKYANAFQKQINAELLAALRKMIITHGMHGPCDQNSCSSCDLAYKKAQQAIKHAEAK